MCALACRPWCLEAPQVSGETQRRLSMKTPLLPHFTAPARLVSAMHVAGHAASCARHAMHAARRRIEVRCLPVCHACAAIPYAQQQQAAQHSTRRPAQQRGLERHVATLPLLTATGPYFCVQSVWAYVLCCPSAHGVRCASRLSYFSSGSPVKFICGQKRLMRCSRSSIGFWKRSRIIAIASGMPVAVSSSS